MTETKEVEELEIILINLFVNLGLMRGYNSDHCRVIAESLIQLGYVKIPPLKKEYCRLVHCQSPRQRRED